MKRPSKKDEDTCTKAAKTICQILAKYDIASAAFHMKVTAGPFDGVNFVVTAGVVEDCLCEDCLTQTEDESPEDTE
jgi:hypothetical protein